MCRRWIDMIQFLYDNSEFYNYASAISNKTIPMKSSKEWYKDINDSEHKDLVIRNFITTLAESSIHTNHRQNTRHVAKSSSNNARGNDVRLQLEMNITKFEYESNSKAEIINKGKNKENTINGTFSLTILSSVILHEILDDSAYKTLYFYKRPCVVFANAYQLFFMCQGKGILK